MYPEKRQARYPVLLAGQAAVDLRTRCGFSCPRPRRSAYRARLQVVLIAVSELPVEVLCMIGKNPLPYPIIEKLGMALIAWPAVGSRAAAP